MKILHVIRSVDPTGGGPIEGVRQLAATNRSLGHTIEAASLDAPDADYVRAHDFPVHAIGPGVSNYGYTSRMVPWLKENTRNYDVVIVEGLWQYHGFAVWRALRDSGTPYVVYTHGMLDPWFKRKYPLKHAKKMLYWPWGEYRVLRDASAVLFTCEEERLLARESFRHYQCNEVVVSYGTAGSDGDPQSELAAFYARFPELRGKRVALFLGRLHEKKGCDLLIEAFAKVLAEDADWQLAICGPDQTGWKTQLEAQAEQLGIASRVIWCGMVNGEAKWGALRAAEVFVLPSHQENFGVAVAEALSCGTPALISNKVNIWREVESGGAGIVAADDLEGTCALLRSWKELPGEEKSRMRARARDCFLREFEIRNAARNLIGTLTSIVERRGAHASNGS